MNTIVIFYTFYMLNDYDTFVTVEQIETMETGKVEGSLHKGDRSERLPDQPSNV